MREGGGPGAVTRHVYCITGPIFYLHFVCCWREGLARYCSRADRTEAQARALVMSKRRGCRVKQSDLSTPPATTIPYHRYSTVLCRSYMIQLSLSLSSIIIIIIIIIILSSISITLSSILVRIPSSAAPAPVPCFLSQQQQRQRGELRSYFILPIKLVGMAQS